MAGVGQLIYKFKTISLRVHVHDFEKFFPFMFKVEMDYTNKFLI